MVAGVVGVIGPARPATAGIDQVVAASSDHHVGARATVEPVVPVGTDKPIGAVATGGPFDRSQDVVLGTAESKLVGKLYDHTSPVMRPLGYVVARAAIKDV